MSEGKRRHLECKVVAGSIIQYGEPTQEAVEIASRGKVVVGGGYCELIDAPRIQCTACQYQWKDK